MNIYVTGTTDFSNNGLGFLTDVISASITDEVNGVYTLTIEYPINGHLSEYLVEGNIIKSKVADGTLQAFFITNTSKNFKTITVTANHIFYLLLDNLLEDVYPQNLSAGSFLNWILSRTQFPNNFTGYSDITDVKSARYVRKNPVEAILGADNSMVNLFGGELKRDNFDIRFMSRIGTDRGVKLEFGKNITGIQITMDFSGVYTRIMPVGYDELILPEKYIDSALINTYPYPKIGVITFDDVRYDPTDESAYHDIEDAYDELRSRVRQLYENGIDKPAINIKVDWLELSKTNEYKQYSNLEKVNLGDTIHSYVLGTNFTTRVIKTVYNPLLDRIEKFEIGTAIASIGTSMNTIYKQMEQITPNSILQAAQENATNLITQAMGGYIYKTQNELYIMNTNDPQTATKVWRWNINGLGYSSTGINGPYGLAMTMDGSIVADFITTGHLNTNVIEGYGSLELQVNENTNNYAALNLRVDSIEQSISDIADITVADENNGYLEFTNIPESEPITIKIHPTSENLSLLYPNNDLFPSESLFMPTRNLVFQNLNTSERKVYEIPYDLYYYDANIYDEFLLDYENYTCQIIKRVEYRWQDIASGEDLSNKDLKLDFPSILGTYNNFYLGLFSSANYRVRETYANETNSIILEDINGTLIDTLYQQTGNNPATINLSRYTLPNDFGEVTFVASEDPNYEIYSEPLNYIQFFDNKLHPKATEDVISLPYPEIALGGGNYRISMESFEYYYLFVRLMSNNVYTTQFPTKVEMNSKIRQTAEEITTSVSRSYATKEEAEELDSRITQTAEEITSTVSATYATKNTTNQLSSRISQTAKGISLTVNNGSTSSGITIGVTKEDGTTTQTSGTIQMTGLVKFTDLSGNGTTTINGANIQTGTLSASKITTGTLDASRVSVTNLNASSINSGTINGENISVTNLTATNINRGTLSGANISIDNGTGFLRMLSGSAYNPYVSALNVSNKSNGISFRNSSSSGNAGSQIGTLHTESNNLVMDATGNILIGGSSMSNGAIGIWSGYIHAGNLNIGQNYINNSNGGQIAINQSISLNTANGGYAYVDGLYANNRILTVGGSPSTLSVKESIEKKDISDIPKILREIDLYDYKYKKEIEEGKNDYGYIIDYLEKIPNIGKYFEFYDAEKNGIKYKQISHEQIEKFLLGSVIELQRQIDKLKKERESDK